MAVFWFFRQVHSFGLDRVQVQVTTATPTAALLASAEPRSATRTRVAIEAEVSPARFEGPFSPRPRALASTNDHRGPHEADFGGDPQVDNARLWTGLDGLVACNLTVQPNGSMQAIMRERRLMVNPVIA